MRFFDVLLPFNHFLDLHYHQEKLEAKEQSELPIMKTHFTHKVLGWTFLNNHAPYVFSSNHDEKMLSIIDTFECKKYHQRQQANYLGP